MKILQVVHTFLPESVGGTEVHTLQLARDLAPRHEVAVFYRIYAPKRCDLELLESTYDGLRVYRLVNNFTWCRAPLFDYFCPGAEGPFLAALDRFRPDLIHFQHLGGGLSTSFLSLAAARGLPTVLTLHDFWCLCWSSQLLTGDGQRCPGPEGGLRCVGCRPRPDAQPMGKLVRVLQTEVARWGWWPVTKRLAGLGLARLLHPLLQELPGLRDAEANAHTAFMARDRYFRGLLDLPDAVLSPSRFLQKVFEGWGVPPGRILYMRNGVDASALAGEPRPRGDRLQLVYVGAIQADKGLEVLVAAMKRLAGAPVDLCIYGDDHATPLVEGFAADLRRQARGANVAFMGVLPRDRLGEVLAGAGALVLASLRYENCPISILEAQYMGVPVIASNIGGMAELVDDGKNGLLFQVGDAEDLAAKIRQLIADPEAGERLRRGIRRPPTTAEVSAMIERVYGAVCKMRRQGRRGVEAQQAVVAAAKGWEGGT